MKSRYIKLFLNISADFTKMTDPLTTTEDYELFRECFPRCLQTFLAEKERNAKDEASQGKVKCPYCSECIHAQHFHV